MRALVQRVSRAAVDAAGERVAEIGPGLLVLLGVTHDDGPQEADRLADKVRALRIFPDAEGRMNEPLGDDRDVLCVSQFTLYGDARKGNRPPTSPPRAPSTPSRCTSASSSDWAPAAACSGRGWRWSWSTTGR
jgi:D-tyrosyl-tRNA(Tyr) deacylase